MSKAPRIPTEEEMAVGGGLVAEGGPGAAMEEAGLAFDPATQHLELSKDERRRTTALMMAIQAYSNIIIKDAEYLRVASDNARRGDGPVIQPATMNAMVDAACDFDDFIAGKVRKMR